MPESVNRGSSLNIYTSMLVHMKNLIVEEGVHRRVISLLVSLLSITTGIYNKNTSLHSICMPLIFWVRVTLADNIVTFALA